MYVYLYMYICIYIYMHVCCDSWKEVSLLHLNCFRLSSVYYGAKLTDESAEIIPEKGFELTHLSSFVSKGAPTPKYVQITRE